MPDGFEPRRELQRIYNLRELMEACRSRTDVALEKLDELLEDENPAIRLAAINVCFDRGFGKPRQHHVVFDPNDPGNTRAKRVVVLPDNGRNDTREPLTIDA